MSAFKDAVQEDLNSVFLNLDEFAETHTVYYDGEEYPDVPLALTGLSEKERVRQTISDLRRGFHHAAKTAEMVDQPVRQGIRILARNGQVQHIFQHFVFGQAFHAVVRHTLLHAGTMILVNRPLFAVCHGSTSFLPLYVFLISLYTERKILQRDK